MYHALLFFHVLVGFFLAAAVVIYSLLRPRRPVNRPTRLIAEILWGVGGLGTLVFGIWLALNRPEYEIWTAGSSPRLSSGCSRRDRERRPAGGCRRRAMTRPSRSTAAPRSPTGCGSSGVVLLLIVMVWKPGA